MENQTHVLLLRYIMFAEWSAFPYKPNPGLNNVLPDTGIYHAGSHLLIKKIEVKNLMITYLPNISQQCIISQW